MSLMPNDATPEDAVPERVAIFQEVCSAPARMIVLRFLLRSGTTGYPQLRAAAAGHMSVPRLHTVLGELEDAGYVADDAPTAAARKPNTTLFWPVRDRIAEDFAATSAYLFGGRLL